MVKRILTMDAMTFQIVWDYAAPRADLYPGALSHIPAMYRRAESRRLSYDRARNIMRDETGILSMPVEPSSWTEATVDDAREYLARHIWAKAVRADNLTREGRESDI